MRSLPPLSPPGQAACVPLADLFTADDLDRHTRRQMTNICQRCPIFTACHEQATAAPAVGFYAGRYYSDRSRIRREAIAA